jgi:hypothetical protein
MDTTKIANMFKNKALELTQLMHAKFPAQLSLPLMMLRAMDPHLVMDRYVDTVHTPYHARITARDATFFLTDRLAALPEEINTSMLAMVRGLWTDLSADDQDSIWEYFHLFERLARAYAQCTHS